MHLSFWFIYRGYGSESFTSRSEDCNSSFLPFCHLQSLRGSVPLLTVHLITHRSNKQKNQPHLHFGGLKSSLFVVHLYIFDHICTLFGHKPSIYLKHYQASFPVSPCLHELLLKRSLPRLHRLQPARNSHHFIQFVEECYTQSPVMVGLYRFMALACPDFLIVNTCRY